MTDEQFDEILETIRKALTAPFAEDEGDVQGASPALGEAN